MQKFIFTTAFGLLTTLPSWAGNIEAFKEHDPFGVSMSIIAMGVVFCALLILFLCFKWSNTILTSLFRGVKWLNETIGGWFGVGHKAGKAKTQTGSTHIGSHTGGVSMKVTAAGSGNRVAESDEVFAAIGMALFLNEDGMHDNESEVLTLADTTTASWRGCGFNQKQNPARKF